jgi:hypothetical protein
VSTTPREVSREPWSWPPTMAAFVACVVAALILPWAHRQAVEALLFSSSGHGVDGSSAFVVASAGLLLIRGGASLAGVRSKPAIAAAYVAFTAAAGAVMMAGTGYPAVIVVLAIALGSAFQGVLWLLADGLTRTGRLHGSAAIFAMFVWFWLIGVMGRAGVLLGSGELPAWHVVRALGLVAPIVLALGGVLALPNRRWPLPFLAGTELRSGLDFALVALAAGSLLGRILDAIAGGFVALSLPIATPLGATAVVGAMLVAWGRARDPGGPREVRLFVPVIALPTLASAALWLSLTRAGGVGQPGPFAGTADGTATATTPSHSAVHDAPMVQARLDSLRVDALVAAADADHLEIAVRGVRSVDRVLDAVLAPGRLAVRYADATEPLLTSADVARVFWRSEAGGRWAVVGLTPAAADRFAAETAANLDRHLVIAVDDEVVSEPVIRGVITGEVAVQPGQRGVDVLVAELAYPLDGTWTVP